MSRARCFAYAGLTICADAADSATLQWLTEFLAPAFVSLEPADGDCAADWQVRLEIDPERYRRLIAAPSVGGDAVAFVLDTGLSRLPMREHAGSGLLVHDDELRAFYEVEAAGGRGRVLVLAGEPRARIRSALMRPVRELGMDAATQRGGLLLHGAA